MYSIMIVEDEELELEFIEAVIQEEFQPEDSVITANTGAQAVRLAKKRHPDMIIMDIQMPKMDGYRAANLIRNLPDAEKKDIPIVAMTANVFAEDKQLAWEAGMNGHIAKPIDVHRVLQVLIEILS